MSGSFFEQLKIAQQSADSWLCVGLDPAEHIKSDELIDFCRVILDATDDLVCAYKPNLGFFLAHGIEGLKALTWLCEAVSTQNRLVILDAKFGDIGSSAERYARFAVNLGVGAVTINPYIGTDAIRPFLTHPELGVFALCRTSNVEGNEFQALSMGEKPLYLKVAEHLAREANTEQLGLVVGATQPDDMRVVRQVAPLLPFLVPGIGAQGGDLEAVVRYGATQDGIGPVINVGRAILSVGGSVAIRQKALEYQHRINQIRMNQTDDRRPGTGTTSDRRAQVREL